MASNAERLDALYERFWHQGDWDAGTEIMAPDIEWSGADDDAMLGGTRYGPRAVNQWFGEWLEAWEIADVEWTMHELAPDIVLVDSRLITRGLGSGVDSDTRVGQIWEFQAIRQRIYRRYEDARAAAEELVRSRGS